MSSTIRHKSLLFVLGICFLLGCSNRASPVGVTGRVTLDGQPVPSGKVQFEPLADGQRRDANIEDGTFALPKSEGVLPGQEFKIVIKAFRKTGRKYPNANMASSYEEFEQFIPSQYNSFSTLTITVSQDESENNFDFNLVSDSS